MKLEGRLEQILDMFSEGATFRSVAKKENVSTRTLNKFLSLPENYDLYKLTLKETSDIYADKAEEILKDAPNDKGELYRAKELAQHYRWMAKARDPKKYGDRIETEHSGSVGLTWNEVKTYDTDKEANPGS